MKRILKLFIVEDEPVALKFLESLVATLDLPVEIVGKARNGVEACKLIEETSIDVVLTDIKMPLMDGLELASYLHHRYPDIAVIILSGFEEFSFARKALQFGVKDYLLKPIHQEKLTQILAKFQMEYESRAYVKFEEQLEQFIVKAADPSELVQLDKSYFFFYVRIGSYDFMHAIREYTKEEVKMIGGDEEIYCINGESKNEFFLISENHSFAPALIERLKTFFHCETFVFVYPKYSFSLAKGRRLYSQCIKLGQNSHIIQEQQVICLQEEYLYDDDRHNQHWQDVFEKMNRDYRSGNWSNLKLDVLRYFFHATEASFPKTYQLVYRAGNIIDFFNMKLTDSVKFSETIFEEVIKATLYKDDLMNTVDELVDGMIDGLKQFPSKVTSEEYHALISAFVDKNYGDNSLSLTTLTNHFGISATSLNYLFKSYSKCTFKEYLLAVRMRRAKYLIETMVDLSLKEVSEKVGYNDALYFSKVFKKFFGETPSDFQNRLVE